MLAQLLKNLYICTFLLVFFCLYLWTDKKSRKWDREKM